MGKLEPWSMDGVPDVIWTGPKLPPIGGVSLPPGVILRDNQLVCEDPPDRSSWFIALCVGVLWGLVVGLIAGFVVGRFTGWL
jgi:hypothetical protein